MYTQLTMTGASIVEQLGQTDDLLLFCDLNLPSISWSSHDDLPGVFLPVEISSENEVATVDGLAQLGLHQLNNVGNNYGNVLETVFSTRHDDAELTCSAPALAPGFFSSASHNPVDLTFETNYSPARSSSSRNPSALEERTTLDCYGNWQTLIGTVRCLRLMWIQCSPISKLTCAVLSTSLFQLETPDAIQIAHGCQPRPCVCAI